MKVHNQEKQTADLSGLLIPVKGILYTSIKSGIQSGKICLIQAVEHEN